MSDAAPPEAEAERAGAAGAGHGSAAEADGPAPTRTARLLAAVAPAAVAIGVVVLLVGAVAVDPVRGVTKSGSPFADEAFNALNARNLVLLGRWSTDGWNLHLVDLPFSALLALDFGLLGVGIVQARLASIVAVGLAVAALGYGLRRPFGTPASLIAALATGCSALVLFYGRLVYQEDLVALFLVAGALALALAAGGWRRGILAGLLLALAIGTKPSAAFAVAGMLVAVGLAGLRSASIRRAVAASVAVIAVAGAAWLLLVWLPDRSAIDDVLRIWPRFTWPDGPLALVRRAAGYLATNDAALLLSLPLALAGLAGLVLVVARRDRLAAPARLLVAAALGWLVAGLGILAVASYRPNRYIVPLLPAAAILVAAGVHLAEPWLRTTLPRARAPAAVVLCLALAVPGLAAHASWTLGVPSTAPAIQAQMAPLVPAGSVVVGGDAPLFLMRAPVVAIVPWAGVPGNEGDLYDSAGARWFLTNGERPPSIVIVPDAAWAARQRVACARWYGTLDCLYRVP